MIKTEKQSFWLFDIRNDKLSKKFKEFSQKEIEFLINLCIIYHPLKVSSDLAKKKHWSISEVFSLKIVFYNYFGSLEESLKKIISFRIKNTNVYKKCKDIIHYA